MSLVYLTIDHGDLESAGDVDALQAIRDAVEPGWRRTVGTNDRTTYVIDRSVLDPALAIIGGVRRPWWKVTVRPEVLG
jgi:hypothetical protein